MTKLLKQKGLPMMSRKRKEVDTSTYGGKFAVHLRGLREKAGLSIEELAEKSGIPKGTIYNWEAGRKTPVNEQFPELAKALNIKIQKLLPNNE